MAVLVDPQTGDPNNITECHHVDQCVPLVGNMNPMGEVELAIPYRPGGQLPRDLDRGLMGSVGTGKVRTFVIKANVIIINMEKVTHGISHIGARGA